MLVRTETKSFLNLRRMMIGGALAVLLGAGYWSAAKAQSSAPATCAPGSGADWMGSSDPLAAQIRPLECASVEQTPPDFGWPELSADAQYFVTITYPDGHQRTRTASQNWINWDEVLPAGTYTWTVQANTSQGMQASRARKFIVGPNATPFLVPDGPTMLASASKKSHPRSLPPATTLSGMKKQRAQAVNDLLVDVSGRFANPLPADPASSAFDASFDEAKYTLNAIVAYVYSGNASSYFKEAQRRVLNLASWDPAGATAYSASGMDMASRQIAWVLAFGYDILAPKLNSSQKNAILAALKVRTADMYNDLIGTRSRLAVNPRDSHGAQTLTFLAVVSTLIAGDVPEASTWLKGSLPQAVNAVSPWGGEDGGYANGSPQGVWDIGDTLPAWYALRWATGVNLAKKGWVKNWARYIAYFNPPGMGKGVFGDGLEMNETEHQARYGKAYTYFAPTPLGRWYASQLTGEDPTRIEYLLAPPADFSTAALPSGTPNSTVFPAIGQMAMHSDLSSSARTSVYFKSSPPPFGAYNHSHADQNSFVVDSGGQRLAIESGYYDDYKTPHWMQWYHQTRAKNAITYDNGKGQLFFEQDGSMGTGGLLSYVSQPDYDVVTGDATAAYGGALTKARRSLVYLRPGLILVYDSVASATPRQWEWNIHALNMMTEINDKQISISSGGQTLCVDMLAGPDMRFSQNSTFTALPTSGDPQWHGKFYSAQTLGSAEFVALMRVGCQAAAGASAVKSNGVWTINAGTKTISINDAGTVSVAAASTTGTTSGGTTSGGTTSGGTTSGGTTSGGTTSGTTNPTGGGTASSTPYTGTPFALPGTLEAENFDKGGEGLAYHDNVKGNAGGQYRTSEDVDIVASSDSAGGGYVINNFETGEWMKYTINVPADGNYDVELRTATSFGSSAYHLEIDGVNVSGRVTVPNTGTWTAFAWSGPKGVPLKAGTRVLKVVSDQQYFNLNQIRFTGGATAAPASTPYTGTPIALPATFEAENFDKGGEGLAYHDNVKGNAGGQYRTTEDVDIVAGGTGYIVNNFETGEWLLYTVNVATAGSYDIELNTASNFTTAAFHVEVDGKDVTGLIGAPYTNDWTAYQWAGKTGVALTAGKHTLKVVADQQYFNLDQVRVLASGTSGGGGTTTPPPSGGGTTTPPTGMPTSLLFWSGYEGTILPGLPYDCWGNGCWQDLTGTDTSTGFAWPPKVNNSTARWQLLSNPTAGAPADTSNIGQYMLNQVQTVTGHKGNATRAMLSTIMQSGCCGTGSQTPADGSTQNPFMIFPASDVPELYISQWIMLQPDLKTKMGANNWRELFEWKTTDTDFRMQVAIKSDGSGNLYWMTDADSYVPSYQEFWRINNTSVPVPVGQWFKLEVYWKRSSTNGRIWAAVNGQVIGDKTASTVGPNGSRMDRIMMNQLYSGSAYPIYQWVDDVQVWSTFPSATSGQGWYDPPYASH